MLKLLKQIPVIWGALAAVIAAGGLFFSYHSIFVTEVEASQSHAQMVRWQLDDVRRQIESTEILKVENKYRQGLSPQARDELAAKYEVKLKRLRKTEDCLAKGNLTCD